MIIRDKIKELKNSIVISKLEITRMRQLRDKYYKNIKKLNKQNKVLKLKLKKVI